MSERSCRACGASLPAGGRRCTGCGARQGGAISRVWILTFFVMGIVIGLLLLVLEQGLPTSWRSVELPEFTREPVAPTPGEQPAPRVKEQLAPRDEEAPKLEALHCDRDEAQRVRQKALSLASISEQGGEVRLALTKEWEYYSAGHRRSFVGAFSEADRCLQGIYRPLRFSFQGDEVATVSASGAITMK